MKVAAYSRVSSDAQDTVLSLSAQIKALKEYALKNGHEVVREFVDESESGRSSNRPAFKEMISLAKAKQRPFDGILVWKLNRFARSREDSVVFKALLKKLGIAVISINEPVDDSPAGRLLEGVIESIDEFYSANLGQDIKRGLRENASRSFFNGSKPPYGLRRVPIKDGEKTRFKLQPDAEESATVQVVRRIFEMADKDNGCKEIAKTLNYEGVRTAKGERWGRTTVHKILTNEAYCGTLVWGGRPGFSAIRSGIPPVRVENAWPSIVDHDLFNRVQKKMKVRGPNFSHPRTVPSQYLLSGFLFCSCGHALTGHSAKSGRNHYYQCSRRIKQGNEVCQSKMLPREKLERQVIDNLKSKVLTNENLEELVLIVNQEIASANGNLHGKIAAIDTELGNVSNRLFRLYDALETGKLTLDDLAPRIKELKMHQEELNKARVHVEAEMVLEGVEAVDADVVKLYAKDLGSLLEDTEFTRRKAVIRSFVTKITVDGKNVKMNYQLPGRVALSVESEVLPTETFGGVHTALHAG